VTQSPPHVLSSILQSSSGSPFGSYPRSSALDRLRGKYTQTRSFLSSRRSSSQHRVWLQVVLLFKATRIRTAQAPRTLRRHSHRRNPMTSVQFGTHCKRSKCICLSTRRPHVKSLTFQGVDVKRNARITQYAPFACEMEQF
jgi:hypothetical protein